ncbi:hypothetical protein [Actinoalloteichus spitiensis]|uniref:hypothetical protein n=1 Tax=Actinoalloteichus spitiensis TaxID=252394 RepID=UPI0012F6D19B|nr:hypothetical protein [Actinoalloteichus spitiensis]
MVDRGPFLRATDAQESDLEGITKSLILGCRCGRGWRSCGGGRGVAGAGAAPQPRSDSAYANWIPEVEESGSLDSPVIMTGSVVAEDGVTPAAGAAPYLQAWPPAKEMETLPAEGETIRLIPIAKTFTDQSGTFELRVDPDVVAQEFRDVNDSVSTTLLVETATGVAHFATGIQVGDEADEPVGEPRLMAAPDLAVMNPVSTGVLRMEPKTAEQRAALASARAQGGRMEPASCGPTPRDLGARWVNVGATYVATTGVWAQLKYSSGAQSSLGIGISFQGGYGNYSRSGSMNLSGTATITYPRHGSTRTSSMTLSTSTPDIKL